jgi:hypothetical protein
VAEENPEIVQLVEKNPEIVQVVEKNPEIVQVAGKNPEIAQTEEAPVLGEAEVVARGRNQGIAKIPVPGDPGIVNGPRTRMREVEKIVPQKESGLVAIVQAPNQAIVLENHRLIPDEQNQLRILLNTSLFTTL